MGYCKKHDQHFMDHVPSCPICRGEKMTWDDVNPPRQQDTQPAPAAPEQAPTPTRKRTRTTKPVAQPAKPKKKGLF